MDSTFLSTTSVNMRVDWIKSFCHGENPLSRIMDFVLHVDEFERLCCSTIRPMLRDIGSYLDCHGCRFTLDYERIEDTVDLSRNHATVTLTSIIRDDIRNSEELDRQLPDIVGTLTLTLQYPEFLVVVRGEAVRASGGVRYIRAIDPIALPLFNMQKMMELLDAFQDVLTPLSSIELIEALEPKKALR